MGNILEFKNRPLPHPCFDEKAKERCGRIHLPVAPACNIQCGYCSRAFDCVNESRPGVTSRVMEPEEAVVYLGEMLIRMPYVTVAGIAGPGDAFRDPERTLTTLDLIRGAHPGLNLCLSTNGLDIGPYIKDLARLGVGYVTVTVNAATPRTGALIYSHVRNGSRILHGLEGARLLIGRQLDAIAALRAEKITIKVNTVVVSGVNEGDVEEIARRVSVLGADIMNIIPVIPVPGTPLGSAPPLSPAELKELRRIAAGYIRQMRHCARCRADAAGLLGCREAKNGVTRHAGIVSPSIAAF
jgi:nitrogen fixation protein NifB